MIDINLGVKLEIFEGPLDLLLKLIDKNKIDIYNIPISSLTDEYLFYIKNDDCIGMNEMSEFVLIASMLLDIKAKMLLPKEKDINTNEEIDPREELVERLIEYKKYKIIAEQLARKDIVIDKVVFREQDKNLNEFMGDFEDEQKSEELINELLCGVSLDDLYSLFKDILNRQEVKRDKTRSEFKTITKALYNINDKIAYIKDLLVLKNNLTFSEIFDKSSSKAEVVVIFLAILELVKLREIKVFQDSNFSNILITRIL